MIIIETDVTIINTNLNKKILTKYEGYHIVIENFKVSDLFKYDKVIFFNILNNLYEEEINSIYDNLKKRNIKFINVTNNMEEVLLTENLIVYNNDEIVLEGNTIDVLKNEKILKRLGFSLPFIIELSLLLKDYSLIDKIYLNKESLVNDLWK